jgi:hypothetical protein
VYDFIANFCRQQAEAIQNCENENVSKAQARKYKRLEIGSSQTHNQGNRINNIKTIFHNSTTTKSVIRTIERTTTNRMGKTNGPQSYKPENKIYYKTVQEHQHGHSIQNQQHNSKNTKAKKIQHRISTT